MESNVSKEGFHDGDCKESNIYEIENEQYCEFLKRSARSYRQIIFALTASLVTLNFGTFWGWFTTITAKLQTNNVQTDELLQILSNNSTENFPKLYIGSQLLGPLIFTHIINRYGRKWTLIAICIPFWISSMLLNFFPGYYQFIFAITLGNMALYISMTITCAYLGEITSPHLRGSLGTLAIIVDFFGQAIGYWLSGSFTSHQSALFMLILVSITILTVGNLPQSPYFLLKNGRQADAKVVLNRLYSEEAAEKEYYRLRSSLNLTPSENILKNLCRIFTKKRHCKLLLIIANLYLTAYVAANVIGFYAPLMFQEGTYYYLSAELSSILLTILLIFGMLLSAFLSTRWQRRFIYQLSFIFCTISGFILVGYCYLKSINYEPLSRITDWFPLSILTFYSIARNVGVGPFSYVFFREIIPVEFLATSTLIIDIFIPVLNTVSMALFEYLEKWLFFSMSIAVLHFISIVSGVIALKTIPETQNKTLEQIQSEINKENEDLFASKKVTDNNALP